MRTGIELPLGMVCCRCGKGPKYAFVSTQGWRAYSRARAGAFLTWPDELRITDYAQDDEYTIVVSFEEVEDAG